MDIRHIIFSDQDFPDCLRRIPDPPQSIYVIGELKSVLARPRLAVVGSRKATSYGRQVTNQLAGEAAGRGIAIISGLAFGIDSIAHQAALEGGGLTLAVLAGGLDRISPASHTWIARQIIKEGGALVSEYPPGTAPYKMNFIERNRLVAGLSGAVLVTEAAAKSGSLHTAAFALDQGKSVMAVPGNINAPMSEGTNDLIKSGALAVTDIKDILLALGLNHTDSRQVTLLGNNPDQTIVLRLIQSGLTKAADLLTQSQLPTHKFNQTLTMLEITGLIYPLGGGQWGLK